MLGQNEDVPAASDLHELNFTPSNPVLQSINLTEDESLKYDSKVKTTLPYLALNEVFIGETMSARVSHLQISKDGDPFVTKTKSSGLCVSTGTGSTSWLTRLAKDNQMTSYTLRSMFFLVSFLVLIDYQ